MNEWEKWKWWMNEMNEIRWRMIWMDDVKYEWMRWMNVMRWMDEINEWMCAAISMAMPNLMICHWKLMFVIAHQ